MNHPAWCAGVFYVCGLRLQQGFTQSSSVEALGPGKPRKGGCHAADGDRGNRRPHAA